MLAFYGGLNVMGHHKFRLEIIFRSVFMDSCQSNVKVIDRRSIGLNMREGIC